MLEDVELVRVAVVELAEVLAQLAALVLARRRLGVDPVQERAAQRRVLVVERLPQRRALRVEPGGR